MILNIFRDEVIFILDENFLLSLSAISIINKYFMFRQNSLRYCILENKFYVNSSWDPIFNIIF